jgi:hypothetical protein
VGGESKREHALGSHYLSVFKFSETYANKLKQLFWIATTNFIFPRGSFPASSFEFSDGLISVIFGLCEIFAVFFAEDIILSASFQDVNFYVAIISTVFATSG